MKNYRLYGNKPFRIAVIHGGPGAPGEMAPVARELASVRGVIEPLQTATSIQGQVEELHSVIENTADLPVILIGYSWGAWLSFIYTAAYPLSVGKLILVSSGPFEEKYARGIMNTRLTRLTEEERTEVFAVMEKLNGPASGESDELMARFGELMARADSYDPLTWDNEVLECQSDIYRKVWREASVLRSSGKLLAMGEKIRCPVVANHGADDPHPAEGVKEPLSRILPDFKFIRLRHCGHTPWKERAARDRFYRKLKSEISERPR